MGACDVIMKLFLYQSPSLFKHNGGGGGGGAIGNVDIVCILRHHSTPVP